MKYLSILLSLIIIAVCALDADAKIQLKTNKKTKTEQTNSSNKSKSKSKSTTTNSTQSSKKTSTAPKSNQPSAKGSNATKNNNSTQTKESSSEETRPNDNSVEFTVNGVSFKMRYVDIDEAFLIGENVVTQELWNAVMGKNSYYSGKSPKTDISWAECQRFVKKLNELTGRYFRLPTEYEWSFVKDAGELYTLQLSGITFPDNVEEWVSDLYSGGGASATIRTLMSSNTKRGADQNHYNGKSGMRLALTTNPTIIIPDGVYMIHPKGDTNFVLDNSHAKVSNGNHLIIANDNKDNSANQRWRVINHGDGSISLISMQDSNYGMNLYFANCGNNKQIVLHEYYGNTADTWIPKKTSNGSYILGNSRDPNYVITVHKNKFKHGQDIKLNKLTTPDGGNQWVFTPVK